MTRARSFCAWCGKPIDPAGRRSRLFEYEGFAAGRQIVAHFHVACTKAMLDLCEHGSLEDACLELTKPEPPAGEAAAVVAVLARPVPQPVAAPAANVPRDLAAEARDLSARGFTPMAISARLRAPYATVSAALSAASAFKHSRGDGA